MIECSRRIVAFYFPNEFPLSGCNFFFLHILIPVFFFSSCCFHFCTTNYEQRGKVIRGKRTVYSLRRNSGRNVPRLLEIADMITRHGWVGYAGYLPGASRSCLLEVNALRNRDRKLIVRHAYRWFEATRLGCVRKQLLTYTVVRSVERRICRVIASRKCGRDKTARCAKEFRVRTASQ